MGVLLCRIPCCAEMIHYAGTVLRRDGMAITVRFFASLREQIGVGERRIDATRVGNVTDVWSAVAGGQPLAETVLVAINQEYAKSDARVRDGDEVAFFPPVTGG